MPLALAAFVGGIAVTESHEANEARRRLRPFRDVFAVLFFVAIGTLIDPTQLPAAAPWIALLLALVVVAKVGVVWAAGQAGAARGPCRCSSPSASVSSGSSASSWRAAAVAAGAIDGVLFMAIIATVALSIAASSIAVRLVPIPASAMPPAPGPAASAG